MLVDFKVVFLKIFREYVMFSFPKRLFAYVFSLLFLGILESSRKSFSFDYLIIETYNRPRCKVCGNEIAAYRLSNKGDGKVYSYVSRNDCDGLIMCKNCYERNRNAEYVDLIKKLYPGFKYSDLRGLLENKSFVDKLPGIRFLMRFNGRYEECAICKDNIDKFFEKIWYKCLDCCHVHEECTKKMVKNDSKETIVLCPICKKYDLERVDPYMDSIEKKKALVTNLVKTVYLKEFLK